MTGRFWEIGSSELRGRCHVCPAEHDGALLAAVLDRFGLDLRGTRVRVGIARGHLIQVVLHVPGLAAADDASLAGAEHFVCAVLGERGFEDWIGEVSLVAAPRMGSLPVLSSQGPRSHAETLPLQDLGATLRAAVSGLRGGLPARPCHERLGHAVWTMFELEPDAAAREEPDLTLQSDLVMVSTCMPEAMKCFLEDGPFFSGRFSASDEQFCFVAYDDRALAESERLGLRRAVEDALNGELIAEERGCVIGGGLGLSHSYVDLALVEMPESLPHLRRVLSRLPVAQHAWLLPCDSEWRGQQLRLFPDA